MSPGSERHMHVVIMEQHAAYPPPVLRPPVLTITPNHGYPGPWYPPPNPGSHGLWSPGPWHGGWSQWGAQHIQRHGGPRHYGHSPHGQQGSGYYGDKEHKKKEPVYSHYCDTCDRGFKNQEKYEEHVSQHVKCQEADCKFRAHEKLVQIHWRNMHGPGAKRIKLDTLEEINKWREERRKNYPTLQNIARKNRLQRAKAERGDVLKTAQFGKMKGMRNNSGGGKDRLSWKNYQHAKRLRKKFRDPKDARPQEPARSEGKSVEPSKEPAISQNNRQTVNPLDMLAGSDPESDSGEEPASTGLVVIPKQVTSGLSKLMSSYGSTSESDSEPEVIPIKKVTKVLEENRQMLEAHGQSMDSRPSSVKAKNTSEVGNGDFCSAALQPRVHRKNNYTNKRRNNRENPVPTKSRTTLLEMLLARDIRHERNVILQCVRYIVQNNFFDCTLSPELQVTSASSPARPKDVNGGTKSKAKSWQDSGLAEKKLPVACSFIRQLEPVDDEIWETDASCVETFGV